MDTYGIGKLVDLMQNYQARYGDRFAPTTSLIQMATSQQKFYS